MQAMLLGAGPDREDRRGAGGKPLPDLVPGETGNLMRLCSVRHWLPLVER